MDALSGSPKSEDSYCVYTYFSSKFPAMTRSSSHDSIMDALSGSPKSEDNYVCIHISVPSFPP